ncbi:MAG TPA: type II toxin-antitoxin system RelE/ParE family toxin [Thermomicrobiales bacterium]|nr:type II toxin-antitoxin system RelE/ParE family toxin [Thermomicrobiales bacterium]
MHLLSAAADELRALPVPERRAMLNALEKLQVIGPQLPYPHSSQVKTSALRELRPRAGRSPWRALYRQVGDQLIILAIVPEAQHDPRGFRRGLATAEERLADYEEVL